MNEVVFTLKLAVVVLLLVRLKVLNVKNTIIYALGVVLVSIGAPEKADIIPELIIAFSAAAFAGHLFLKSVVAHTRAFNTQELKLDRKRLWHCYTNPFLSMLAISTIFLSVVMNPWFAIILPFIILAIFDAANKYRHVSRSPPNRLFRRAAYTAIFTAAIAFKKYSAILGALQVSLIYVSLLAAYDLIKSTYTRPYKISELTAGMLPAETITYTNDMYLRQTGLFSIYSAIYSLFFKRLKYAEIITPFKTLDAETITALKKAGKRIDYVLIQKTIGFGKFLIIGIIAAFLFTAQY